MLIAVSVVAGVTQVTHGMYDQKLMAKFEGERERRLERTRERNHAEERVLSEMCQASPAASNELIAFLLTIVDC